MLKTRHPGRKAPPPAVKLNAPKALAPLMSLAHNAAMGDEGSLRKRWSEEETVLALYLYF